MRKFPPLVLLLALITLSSITAFAQSRARRVGPNAPAPVPSPAAPDTGTRPAPRRSSDDARQRDVNEEVGDDELVSVNTTLVTLPVSIMDRDGRFIPNLQKEDFRIFEDNVEQEVAYFATVEKPFTVALVLDTSGSTHFKLDEIQDAAIAFVEQLRPEDRVLVVSFDDQIKVLAEATSDRRTLSNAIRRTHTGGGTKLYDAVDWVIKQRLNRIEGRKAIVLFTDGVDTTSKHATYSSNVSDAEELDALIYPMQYDTYEDSGSNTGGGWPGGGSRLPNILGLPFPFPVPGGGGGRGGSGVGTSREDYRRAGMYLREMAEKTGGRLYRADSMRYVEEAFSNIAEELRRQYSLGYYPLKQTQAVERRQIKVRVKRPNLVVRSRDSYIYKPAGATTTAQDDTDTRRPAPPELRRPRPFVRSDESAMKK